MTSFMIILLLVIIALVILSILFAVFKFMLGLLPAAIIVALIFWIIYRVDKNKKAFSSSTNKTSSRNTSKSSGRIPARDVKVKDVEDEEEK